MQPDIQKLKILKLFFIIAKSTTGPFRSTVRRVRLWFRPSGLEAVSSFYEVVMLAKEKAGGV